jgi:hypothetical protein
MQGSEFFLQFKNFGKTPAESVSFGYRIAFNPIDQNRRGYQYIPPLVISPTQAINKQLRVPFMSDSLYERIIMGKQNVYLCALITYKDIYGRADTTEFSFVYYGRTYEIMPFGINRMK